MSAVLQFRCGHPRDEGNSKLVRNRTGIACRTCFNAHDREYKRVKRAKARGDQS